MPRVKFQTLTEQMFYILLSLRDECYGIEIFEKIRKMTDGNVSVGSGTLYNLLEQFLEADMIREVSVSGRKRSYILTPYGKEILKSETERLKRQINSYRQSFGEENGHEND